MHATIFGNVTAIVQRMYGARKSMYNTKLRDLRDFSILHSVPEPLSQRMQDYFQTMWSLNHGIDPVEVKQAASIVTCFQSVPEFMAPYDVRALTELARDKK